MPQNSIWRAVLIVVLSLALATPAKANNLDNAARNIIIGIVVVTAAVAVAVTVVIMHESKKDRTITGCVKSERNGMTIADERDQQVYSLTGNTVGITPGDRMSLKGKKAKSKRDQPRVWVATSLTKDLGVCQP
ncbi:MAG: hypothetical protein WAL56_08665 [Candidatus Sulfotelmatobacter sp.]